MAKTQLFDTTRTLVDLQLVDDLTNNFTKEGGRQRERGRGKDDLLGDTSSVAVNSPSVSVSDQLTNRTPIIPEPSDDVLTLTPSASSRTMDQGVSESLPNSVSVVSEKVASPIVENEPISGVSLAETPESVRGQGKGAAKGQKQPLDTTSGSGESLLGHQGSDRGGRPENRGRDFVGEPVGGPPEGKGPPEDHGGGGGEPEESAGNNLSFPVIWAEGSGLTVPGTPDEFTFTTPYDLNEDGKITDADKIEGYYQFAQKTTGNLWQAETASVDGAPIYVTEIDWGDSLESVDMNVGRPIRVELSLYKDLGITYGDEADLPEQMLSFPMTMLDNPSSPDEIQGAGASQYPITGNILPDSMVNTQMITEATVYSTQAYLIIQPLVGTSEQVEDGDLFWTGSQWEDADLTDQVSISDPLTGITFAGELNVGGKVIYGLSEGGWQPTQVGDYRITFYIAPDANAQLDYASIRLAAEEEVTALAAEEGEDSGDTSGGIAVVVGDLNLSYIDISVVDGGGGGIGGSGGHNDSLSASSLDFNAISAELSGLSSGTESTFVM